MVYMNAVISKFTPLVLIRKDLYMATEREEKSVHREPADHCIHINHSLERIILEISIRKDY